MFQPLKALILVSFLLLMNGLMAQTTYYSRNAGSGGNWNAATSWTLNADGSGAAAAVPSRTDNVVILAGHTITINNTNDNGSAGISADALGSNIIGAFTTSGTSNFYQIGDITVNSTGFLVSNTRLMLAGSTFIDGTITSTGDIINLGLLNVSIGATLSCDDDIILSGKSKTLLENTSLTSDDIYIDHTYARLCGSGTMNIGVTASNTPTISYFNGATVAQLCSGFQVTCGPDPACSGFPVNGTGAFSFDITNFTYYKFLTINSAQVPGDLTDFPVLISFSSPDIRTTADGGHVENANGYDIIFTSSQYCGVLNILDFEVESYSSNTTTGTIVAWVNVPFVSASTNTDIFIYYGNSSQTANLSTPAVFDNNYSNVYHMNNNFNDATFFGNNGTNGGTANQATAKIAAGRTYSAGDYIQVPIGDMSTAAGTFSTWCNASSFSTNHQYIVGHTSSTTAYVDRLQLYCDDIGGNLDLGLGSSHTRNTNIYDFNTAEWYYVVLTWDGSNHEVFVNGTSQVASTYTTFGSLNTFMDIGNDGRASARNEAWIGDLDEARVSTVVRSDNWIQTEYNNQNNPGAFFTAGSELTNTCIPLPIELLSFTAEKQGENVLLEWTTLSEINNDFFTIERSKDLKTWEEVTRVKGAGNSGMKRSYYTIDDNPYPNTSYYQLSQTDYDGKHVNEKIVAVSFSDVEESVLYPNPTNDKLTFYFHSNYTTTSNLVITDLVGKEILNKQVSLKTGQQNISIDCSSFENGLYLLNILMNDELITKKFVKN